MWAAPLFWDDKPALVVIYNPARSLPVVVSLFQLYLGQIEGEKRWNWFDTMVLASQMHSVGHPMPPTAGCRKTIRICPPAYIQHAFFL